MKECVVCGNKNCGIICSRCDFDHSKNYEAYATLSGTIPFSSSISTCIIRYRKKEANENLQKVAPENRKTESSAVVVTENRLENAHAAESSSPENANPDFIAAKNRSNTVPDSVETDIPQGEKKEQDSETDNSLAELKDESYLGGYTFLAVLLICIRVFMLLLTVYQLYALPTTETQVEWNAFEPNGDIIYIDQGDSLGEDELQVQIVSIENVEEWVISSESVYTSTGTHLMTCREVFELVWEAKAPVCEKPELKYGESEFD